MSTPSFATAVNCMDGRVQEPVSRWMRERFGVDYVDTVTEPGPDGVLAFGRTSDIESIKKAVTISVTAHRSVAVAVVGHHDCSGNPVSKEVHQDQIRHAVDIIRSWLLPVPVLGLWVNDKWAVEVVRETEAVG
ncbi:MAG: carbonic anhydrase [Planctomycetota bacterium]|jgi:hypothetical protein